MAKLSVQAAKEKIGKAEITAEDEKFDALVLSKDKTKAAFTNLLKIGRSIYATENARLKAENMKLKEQGKELKVVANPADAFTNKPDVEGNIKDVILRYRDYSQARKLMDSAKAKAKAAALAAENPGKDANKKVEIAEKMKAIEEEKTREYMTAKELFVERMDLLHAARDAEFQKSVDSMCQILNNLKPDWDGSAAPPSIPEQNVDDEKVVENPDNDVGGVNPPAQMKAGTDSESD